MVISSQAKRKAESILEGSETRGMSSLAINSSTSARPPIGSDDIVRAYGKKTVRTIGQRTYGITILNRDYEGLY